MIPNETYIIEPLGHEMDAGRADLLVGLGPGLTQKLAVTGHGESST